MNPSNPRFLFAFSVLTAVATLLLLVAGGLVTSHGAGMSVPDWPTSNGYNMFLFPISYWVGGVFYEHSHRLIASLVGLLTVLLTRWLGGSESRKSLAIVGSVELVAGVILAFANLGLKGTGHFLSGIGAVVLLAAAVPFRHPPAPSPLPALGWIAFWAVQLQGLLGGLRVVLFKDEIGIFHAVLAQMFFVLICVIGYLTCPRKPREPLKLTTGQSRRLNTTFTLAWVSTTLILCQLVLAATMRHQHAGLAVPDFPKAYGSWWPDTRPEAIAAYNRQRIEVTAVNDITASQIKLHMAHRILALVILGAVISTAFSSLAATGPRSSFTKLSAIWILMILLQGTLGAYTVWSNKAADIATLHLLGGAASLAFGTIVCILLCGSLVSLGSGSASATALTGGTLGNPSIAG